MNKTQLKDNLREIKANPGRFISILALLLIAGLAFTGVYQAVLMLQEIPQDFFDRSNFEDVNIVSTLGLDEKDQVLIGSNPYVEDFEMAYIKDVYEKDSSKLVRLEMLTETISRPVLIEGRLPESHVEIVLSSHMEGDYEIGDLVYFEDQDGSSDIEGLHRSYFDIVGFVQSPSYLPKTIRDKSTISGATVDSYAYILEPAFDMDYYSKALVKVDSQGDFYTKTYQDMVRQGVLSLEDSFEDRPEEKFKEINKDIDDLITEAQDQIDQAKEDLAKAEADLDQGQRELIQARIDIDQADLDLVKAKKDLDQGQADYYEGLRKFEEEIFKAQEEIHQGQADLDKGYEEIQDGKNQMAQGQADLDQAVVDLADGIEEYEKGQADLAEAIREFEKGRSQYRQGLEDYQEGQAKLESGKAQYRQGLRQYDQGVAKLEKAKADLAEGQAQLAKIEAAGIDLRTLPSRIQALQGDLETNKAQAETLQAQAKDLGLKAEESSSLAQALGDQAKDKAGQIESLSGQAQTQATRAQDLLAQVASLETQIASARDQADQDQVQALQSQLASVQAQAQEAAGQAETLKSQAQRVAEEAKSLEAQAIQAGDQAKSLSDQAQKVGNEAKAYGAKAQEAGDQLQAIQGQFQALGIDLESMSSSPGQDPYQDIAQGQAQIAQGERDLEKARQDLEAARIEIAQGEKDLAQAQGDLSRAKEDLDQGQREIDQGQSDLDSAKETIDQARIDIQAGQRDLDQARQDLAQAQADYQEGLEDLEEGKKELEDQRAKGQRDLASAKTDLESGQAKYREGLAQLRQAKIDLAQGEANYQEGLDLYEDEAPQAYEDIGQAEDQIQEAKEDQAQLKTPEFLINSRDSDETYLSVQGFPHGLRQLVYVFSFLTLAVAILVTSNNLTRMIDENRTIMGTYKGLGYSPRQIAMKFVLFGGISGILGAIIGAIFGQRILGPVIFDIYMGSTIFEGFRSQPNNWLLLAGLLVSLITTVGVALASSYKSLRENTADLLKPKPPKEGNRIFLENIGPIWSRLSFMNKITARNIFRYKTRMLMTILGVGVCVGLLILGISMKFALANIVDYQYGDILKYQASAYLDEDIGQKDLEKILADLVDKDTNVLTTRTQSLKLADRHGYNQDVTMYIGDGDFENFIGFYDRDHEPIDLEGDGLYLSEKLAKNMDLEEGDLVPIEISGQVYDFKLAKIIKNFVFHRIYVNLDYYGQVTGTRPQPNTLMVLQVNDQVEDYLNNHDMVISFVDNQDIKDDIQNNVDSLDVVVLIIAGISMVLAFVVQYSLTSINVAERQRELSTMKVLGFYSKEITQYVFKETGILSLLGILLGLPIGKIIVDFILDSFAPAHMMFGDPNYPLSMSISALMTMAFTIVVMLVVHRNLKEIDMLEALSSVE